MSEAQPRLRFWLAEFYGRAKTVTGNVWWYEERQDDGSIRRVPLIPIEPRTEGQSEERK